jgi:hypothetical protein
MLRRPFSRIRKTLDRAPSSQHAHRAAKGALLRGEQLEDRCLPATYTWNGPAEGDGLWSTNTNWSPNGVPGASDVVRFDGTKSTESRANVAKVQSFLIEQGYKSIVRIENAQGIPLTLEVTNVFRMLEADATVIGGAGVSTLKLSGAGNFTWAAGRMRGIDIVLGSATEHTVVGEVRGNVVLEQSRLINHSSFTWRSGWISVPNGDFSEIVNEAGGTFEILAYAGYGSDQDQKSSFINRGLIRVNTAGVALQADFLNAGGTVRVYPGGIYFHHKAEQSEGTFEFRSGNVWMQNSGQVLRIYGGLISGSGTVNGNLTLGNAVPGDESNVAIAPILDGAPATIAITQSFHEFSSCTQTSMAIDAVGTHSKITVGGYAVLNGDMFVEKHVDYKPPLGTELNLISTSDLRGGVNSCTITNNSWTIGGGKPLPPPVYFDPVFIATAGYYLVVRQGT